MGISEGKSDRCKDRLTVRTAVGIVKLPRIPLFRDVGGETRLEIAALMLSTDYAKSAWKRWRGDYGPHGR